MIEELALRLENLTKEIASEIESTPLLKEKFNQAVQDLGAFKALYNDQKIEWRSDLSDLQYLWVIASHPDSGKTMEDGMLAALASIKMDGCSTAESLDIAMISLKRDVASP